MHLRTVRSFVRRAGRMTPSQESGLQRLWEKYGLSEDKAIDPQAVFERQAPLTLDIGFGMGESLLAQAQLNPEQDFIGVEVHKPGVGRLLNEVEGLGLTNVRVMMGDVTDILSKSLGSASVDRVQLFFPDPWPKKKHHKRRLVQPEFLKSLSTKLRPGAIVHFATDWEDYYLHMEAVMAEQAQFLKASSEIQAWYARHRPRSRFEQRGLRLGHNLYDCVYTFKDL